jgi:cytochrome P450
MTSIGSEVREVPEIDLTDPAVLRDPFTAYGRARERSPLARLMAPGFGPMWAVTRHQGARAMLADPRFQLNAASYMRPDVPEDCLPYMRTMQEMDGPEHTRLRRLAAPAFSARRAARLRPRIEPIVERLLDDLPRHADGGAVDLLAHFARPLPIDVICELVGIPAPTARDGGSTARPSRPARASGLPRPSRGSWRAPRRRWRPGGPSPVTT